MKRTLAIFVAVLVSLPALVPRAALAQQLVGLTPEKERVTVNEPLKLVFDFKQRDLVWCGLNIDFGDGDVRLIRVEQNPLSLHKVYAAAGRYLVKAQGALMLHGLKTALPCEGNAQSAVVQVVDADAENRTRAAEAEAAQRARVLEARERELKAREQALNAATGASQPSAANANATGGATNSGRRKDASPNPRAAAASRPAPAASAVKGKPRDDTLGEF